MVSIDIHQFGHSLIVIIHDTSDPNPYRWAIVPTNKVSFVELQAESWLAFVHATATGEASSQEEANAQIAEAL